MSLEAGSLWEASPTWRRLLLLAGALVVLGLLGAPWQPQRTGPAPTAAAPSYQPIIRPVTPVTTTPQGPPNVAAAPSTGQADMLDPSLQMAPPVAMPPPPPVVVPRHSTSSVVWSSEQGRMPGPSVSGGGLILLNTRGGTSTGYASRGMTSGRHYWEFTLSTQPGEPFPQTWSAAGVVPRGSLQEVRRPIVAGVGRDNGGLVVPVGRDRTIRGGDVLMFALDADQKVAWWGLNGQWRNGTPGGAGGAVLTLSQGEHFFPFGNVTSPNGNEPEGDRWIANFGGSRFRYPVPQAFDAYGTTGGATQFAGAPSTAGARPAAPDSLLGKTVQGVVQVSGQTVPLPQGTWTVLAHFKGNAGKPGDAMLMGQLQGNAMRKMVAVHAARTPRSASQPTFRSCLRQDVLFQSNDDGRSDSPRCWWVNHAVELWDTEPLFKAAQPELQQRGVQPSSVWLNVGFYRSNADGFATAFYYFDPSEAGIASQAVSWTYSEWHKSRIGSDPQRAEYAKRLTEWGREWAPIYFASN
jgi:hypothetical protein